MNKAGATLPEVLAALTIVSLAMGGLMQATGSLARLQSAGATASAEAISLSRLQTSLDRLFQSAGPLGGAGGDTLAGEPTKLSFPCDGGPTCRASLDRVTGGVRLNTTGPAGAVEAVLLKGEGAARFDFAGPDGASSRWPPARNDARLVAVSVVRLHPAGGEVVAATRLWNEQRGYCAFDTVSRDCRRE